MLSLTNQRERDRHLLSTLPTHTPNTCIYKSAKFAPQPKISLTERVLKAFAREKQLCQLLKDIETANRCLRSHKPIPASCSEHTSHSLDVLLPLIAQQAVLLEQAATAGVGGTLKRAAEDAPDFRLFADDSCTLYALLI
jgi:hypothetical protein